MEKSLKKDVYDYFKNHANNTAVQCAVALKQDGIAVMHEINALRRKGCLSQNVVPLGNDKDPNNSAFYFVCGPFKQ